MSSSQANVRRQMRSVAIVWVEIKNYDERAEVATRFSCKCGGFWEISHTTVDKD